MSASTPSYELAIRQAAPRALTLVSAKEFEREATFAAYAVSNAPTPDLMNLAKANPGQLTEAVVQACASGVSLNPALGLAYLVPRGGKIRLEFGYQGFIQLATASGAVLDVFVELVREGDQFRRGVRNSVPYIDHEPGDGSGAITGGYCLATLPSSRVVPCYMSKADIDAIRKNSKSSAWNSAYAEMAKKTIIRRARKTWPKQIAKLEQALAVDELEDGVDLSGDGPAPIDTDAAVIEPEVMDALTPAAITDEQATTLREWIDATAANEDAFLRFFEAPSLEAVKSCDYEQALSMLQTKAKKGQPQ